MNRAVLIFLLASLAIVSCDKDPDQATETAAAKPEWNEFVIATVAEYYRRNPETAVSAGLHEYDGQMKDFSQAALKNYGAWMEDVIASADSYTDLGEVETFERDYLINAMNGRLFWLRDADYPTRNPSYYMFSVSVYLDRDYAPLEQRIAAYTQYISQVPRRLGNMMKNLKTPVATAFLDISHKRLTGYIDYLENTVPEVFDAVDDEQLQRQFTAANNRAIEAVKQAVEWLDELTATGTKEFALGQARFLRMLSATQGIEITLGELKAAGEADLQRNLDALEEACARFAPGASTRDCVSRIESSKPAEGPVAGATRQLAGLRQFLIDNNVVSIPSDEVALVDEAPAYRRFNIAYISIPGPYDSGLPAVYYIAPPDPEWSEENRRAYIPSESVLLGISVHEVWPGHFLERLHTKRADNNVGPNFGVSTFSEGWAHYVEQMMWDAGLGNGDPEVHIGQLLNALKRNVRYLSAIGLHTEGMTVRESQALFEEKAFKDFGNASQQALRGTYDPGYLSYTLGKLMINKLREDWTASRGGREAWRPFHDQFLSYGRPPLPLVREQMLGPDYAGDEALLPN